MAQQSHATVIGPQFIAPHKFDVVVNRRSNGYLVITDTGNQIMFTIRSCDTTVHRQRLLRDKDGRLIATLREKNKTAHNRWNAYWGESKAKIFSATRNHMIQNHTDVIVSLGNKTCASKGCDFRIEGSWSGRNCAICKGDSSTIMAEMGHLNQSPEEFKVTIYPNVDLAFVVALIATVDAMKSPAKTRVVAGHVAAQVTAVAAGVAAQFIGGVIF